MKHENLDFYGDAPIPWSRALEQLNAVTELTTPEEHHAGTPWLATTRRGGRPHLTAVGALWVDEKFCFTSGAETRKSLNLAANSNCIVSVSLPDIDLVVEGTAAKSDGQGHSATSR